MKQSRWLIYFVGVFLLSACGSTPETIETLHCDPSVAAIVPVYYDTFINSRDVDDLEQYSDLIVVGSFVKQLDSRVSQGSAFLSTRYVFRPDTIIKGVVESNELWVDVLGGCLSSELFFEQRDADIQKILSASLLEEKYPEGQPVLEQAPLVVQNFGTNPSLDPEQRYVLYLTADASAADVYSILLLTHGFKPIRGAFVYSVGNEGEVADPFLLSRYGA